MLWWFELSRTELRSRDRLAAIQPCAGGGSPSCEREEVGFGRPSSFCANLSGRFGGLRDVGLKVTGLRKHRSRHGSSNRTHSAPVRRRRRAFAGGPCEALRFRCRDAAANSLRSRVPSSDRDGLLGCSGRRSWQGSPQDLAMTIRSFPKLFAVQPCTRTIVAGTSSERSNTGV